MTRPMTRPELEDFRKELIQTAAVIVSAIEDIDTGRAFARDDPQPMHQILNEIDDERYRQDMKWGPQHHRMADWLAIIGEEYGEACMAYVDDLLMPTILEQKRIGLNPPAPIKWGDRSAREILAEGYGTPTTVRVDESVLVNRAARRMRGEVLDPLVFKTPHEVAHEATVKRQKAQFFEDDDDHDPNEGRYDRQD